LCSTVASLLKKITLKKQAGSYHNWTTSFEATMFYCFTQSENLKCCRLSPDRLHA